MHLRFGPVARGGLRWSDRAQDYRTEVLGLVKAQQVKNAVIVPVGAKGGFFPKRSDGRLRPRRRSSRPAASAYINFVSSLLSVTDNHRRRRGRAAERRRAPRPGRSLFRRRRRQGHGDLLRHRQRDQPEARLLARRRLRVRRLGRLRPQEDGHHRQGRLGGGEAAFPRDEPRHPDRRPSPSSASATCRATCSATACCCPTRRG